MIRRELRENDALLQRARGRLLRRAHTQKTEESHQRGQANQYHQGHLGPETQIEPERK